MKKMKKMNMLKTDQELNLQVMLSVSWRHQEGNATPIGQLVQILLLYYARNYRTDGRTSCPIHHHLEV